MAFTQAHIEQLAKDGKIRGYKSIGGSEVKADKKSKYRAQPTVRNGIRFASKKEACRFDELMILQRIGVIHFVNIQVRFKLSVCEYWSDFTYLKDGELVIEDCKSKATQRLPTYRLKKKMMANELGIEVKEI